MKQKTILVSPLNWGLGHSVRDIPLIHKLIEFNYRVIIASEGASAILLKKEFPKLTHIEIKSFKIEYPKNKGFTLKILSQIPKVIFGIRREHLKLKQILKKYDIDLIISDNRYGIYSKEIPSIFITHQVFIKLPKSLCFLENRLHKVHLKKLNKFNKVLIPDYLGQNNLTGELSHSKKLPANFMHIGILSEFDFKPKQTNQYLYDILVIISGPEPQRTIFETIISEQLKNTKNKVLIVTGKPQALFNEINNNIELVNHLSRKEMQDAITNSKIIISRAGYTTIMDLVKLQKKAILIPTPGQTEQEYLSNYLKKKNIFVFMNQSNLNISEAINKLNVLEGDFAKYSNSEYEDYIKIIKSAFTPNYLDNEKCVSNTKGFL